MREYSNRSAGEYNCEVVRYRNVILCPQNFLCEVEGQPVKLTPVEFRMLQAMITHPGHVLSRDLLMDRSYTDGRIVSYRTIDSHVKNLRRKLTSAGTGHSFLHSVYGIGYKLE
jgi:two-component system, OmpR family, response regulator BaeR